MAKKILPPSSYTPSQPHLYAKRHADVLVIQVVGTNALEIVRAVRETSKAEAESGATKAILDLRSAAWLMKRQSSGDALGREVAEQVHIPLGIIVSPDDLTECWRLSFPSKSNPGIRIPFDCSEHAARWADIPVAVLTPLSATRGSAQTRTAPVGPSEQCRATRAGLLRFSNEWRDEYEGSADELLAAGVVCQEHVAELTGSRNRKFYYGNVTVQRIAGGRLRVTLMQDRQEAQARSERQRAINHKVVLAKGRAYALERARDSLPSTADGFRQAVLMSVDHVLNEASGRSRFPEPYLSDFTFGQGFSLSAKDLARIQELEGEIRNVIRSASVVERPGVWEAYNAAIERLLNEPLQRSIAAAVVASEQGHSEHGH